MNKYPKYKESGIAWLREIPEHWEVESFKNILTERNEKNNPVKSKEILSLSIDKGITLYAEKTTNLDRFKDDLTKYKLAHKGDLVLNSMNMIVGAVGVSGYFGCVSPVYYTFYGDSSDAYTSRFYEYLFRCKTVKSVLYSLGRGLIAIDRGEGKYNTLRLKVSRDDLRSMRLPLPNISEQIALVNFLDFKTEKIERFITKKKQLIELLNEQKAAIINQAVTKGLNPNAKMKPSGIEWLGDIPEGWVQTKLKSIGFLYGGLSGKSGKDFKIDNHPNNKYYIPFTNIANNSIINNNQLDTFIFNKNEKQNEVLKNDLLFLMSSETYDDIGKTALMKYDIDEVYLNSFCKGFRIVDKNINASFLNFLLMANINRKQLIIEARGFTRINLKIQKVKDLTFFYPNSTKEQIKIVDFIQTETKKIEKTISTIAKEIALVEEYKTVLIAEAVTGKIDVREFEVPQVEIPLAMVAEEVTSYKKV